MAKIFNKRVRSIALILGMAVVAVTALLLLMEQLAPADTAPLPPSAPARATPPEPDNNQTIATVNDAVITRPAWQQATRLDTVMSRLASQPIPTAEETLDRLVNEIIVLDAVENIPAPTGEEIEAKIAALATIWNVTDRAMVAALEEAGLSRSHLTGRVGRLLQVEAALNQLAAQERDLDAWLTEARASAEIGLYRSLVNVDTPPAQPAADAGDESSTQPQTAAGPIAPTNEPVEFAPPPDLPVSPYPENAAPDFTLSQLNGEPLTLSNFRGKPTIINFWATWCPPCRQELPALQAAYTAHREEIGFVAVDVKEEAATVNSFVNELGLNFPVVIDPDGAVSDVAYQVRGLPTTLFLDANGVVAARHVGPLDEAAIDTYLAPLLETSPPLAELPAGQQNGPSASTDNLPDAPHFNLTAADGTSVSLQDYQDKSSLVLVFYRGHT